MSNNDTLPIYNSEEMLACCPIDSGNFDIDKYESFPIVSLSSLGTSISAIVPKLTELFQKKSASQSESMMFKMVIPNGLKPGEILSVGKNGLFNGNIVDDKSGKILRRAGFMPMESVAREVLNINPSLMMMSLALSVVTQKLDAIEESQKSLLEFLEMKEKAALRGNIETLKEILVEYKFNWDNDKFKSNKHIQVQEIKREAENSITLLRERISKAYSKRGFFQIESGVKDKIKHISDKLEDYELGLYIFSFSSFLEVMLLENFSAGYLNAVNDKIAMLCDEYNTLRSSCYDAVLSESKSSFESVLVDGASKMGKGVGEILSKWSVTEKIGKGLADSSEKLSADSIKHSEELISRLSEDRSVCTLPFTQNITALESMFNHPAEIAFDKDNIYYLIDAAEQK